MPSVIVAEMADGIAFYFSSSFIIRRIMSIASCRYSATFFSSTPAMYARQWFMGMSTTFALLEETAMAMAGLISP